MRLESLLICRRPIFSLANCNLYISQAAELYLWLLLYIISKPTVLLRNAVSCVYEYGYRWNEFLIKTVVWNAWLIFYLAKRLKHAKFIVCEYLLSKINKFSKSICRSKYYLALSQYGESYSYKYKLNLYEICKIQI